MKKSILSTLFVFIFISLSAQEWQPQQWPVLKTYDQNHLYQIALPLGGIGTGTVSLGGRGELRDWEIMNIRVKNTAPLPSVITPRFLPFMPNRKRA